MKVATILGTRPEIIRLSLLIPKLDAVCDHVLIHTGQNSDERLSQVFFDELNVRPPDHYLQVQAASFGEQVGQILRRVEQVLVSESPDRVLILGDTNSALAAIVAKRLRIAVFHMEAGNRCWDDRVPEEVNRRIVDHASDVLMPYTGRSRENLLREGIASHRIFVTGNPIAEVIRANEGRCSESQALAQLALQPGGYFLATLHRAENVDEPGRLAMLLDGLNSAGREYQRPVIVSAHPRMRSRVEAAGIEPGPHLRLVPPFGFHDFIELQRNAFCVLTDSGTVQEESAILGVPSVTVRDVTERPETMECGANILAGSSPEALARAVSIATRSRGGWSPPAEYMVENVSGIALRLIAGYHHNLPGTVRA